MKKWQGVLLYENMKDFLGSFIFLCSGAVAAALFLKSLFGFENTVIILLALIFVGVSIAAFFTVARHYLETHKNISDEAN